MRTRWRTVLVAVAAALAVGACGGPGTTGSPRSTGASASASPAPPAGSGVAIGELGNVDLAQLRRALLGEPPYPSGWEQQVDDLLEEVRTGLEEMRVPDVAGLDPTEAACALWLPLVGNTDWGTGAFLERQFFIAHLAALAGVAPPAIRPAAAEALAISGAAAAEQVKPDGDPAIVARHSDDAVRMIGLWAVDHCDIPVEAEEAPDTEGWTKDEIAYSCSLDRSSLERGQEAYRDGPGDGLYAEHPHVLEVAVPIFVYPAWHRLVAVDNDASPPTYEIEPFPGSFCDL